MPTPPPNWLQRTWAYLGSEHGQKDISAFSSAGSGALSLAQAFATRGNLKTAEKLDAQMLRRYYRTAASRQKVQYAKSGIRLDRGDTPMDVIAGDADLLDEDLYANRLRIRNLQRHAMVSGVAGAAEGFGRANLTLLSKKLP